MLEVRNKLILMNFLQFAVWGVYLTSMGNYLSSINLASKIGLFYAMQGIVSIFMPTLLGIIADRWIPAQRLLGYAHLLAGVFIIGAGYYGMVSGSGVSFNTLFLLYTLSILFYMPTIGLSNSVSYYSLSSKGLDITKHFPYIRIFGTIGFIVGMLMVNFLGFENGELKLSFANNTNFNSFQNNYNQFFLSGILSLLLFIYSFALPYCPVKNNSEKRSLANTLGLRAFNLFKDRNTVVFFIFSMFLGVSLQITNGYANPFISSFKDIPEYASSWGTHNANALISLSQISETLCILLIPFVLKKYGIKIVMLMAMVAWSLRFGLFAIGNPSSGIVFFVLSMIVYGIAFDFFNVSGSIYIDSKTSTEMRSSAQGIFMMMTNGLGATIGMLGAQAVVNHFVFTNHTATEQLKGWQISWTIFALYALIIAILFGFLFKYKHQKNN
ncbi:MAG: MFS transporter [Bacteroidota bacterium]|nr:MFS transporter [Bacteroidota bacterium]